MRILFSIIYISRDRKRFMKDCDKGNIKRQHEEIIWNTYREAFIISYNTLACQLSRANILHTPVPE